MYDLFFLSHGESMADGHWQLLSSSNPHARRVDGIDGILNAHKHCAALARTSNFFVVDADNEVLDMDFGFKIPDYDKHFVHIWRAKNPVNDLIYGWGGIKLFPKKAFLSRDCMPLDMTMSFQVKIMLEVASVTHFNSTPFDTWRSAFRECVKLSQNADQESLDRLDGWCARAHGPYAEWCLRGALMGRKYGADNKGQTESLMRINDWPWLQGIFENEKTRL